MLCYVCGEGVIGVRCAEEGLYGEKDGADLERRGPLVCNQDASAHNNGRVYPRCIGGSGHALCMMGVVGEMIQLWLYCTWENRPRRRGDKEAKRTLQDIQTNTAKLVYAYRVK